MAVKNQSWNRKNIVASSFQKTIKNLFVFSESFSIFRWRWLILSIFPLGWLGSLDYFKGANRLESEFTDLTIISFLASILILWKLRGRFQLEANFWVIYLLLSIGHHLQLYGMLYWHSQGSKTINIFPSALFDWLLNLEHPIELYQISTFSLVGFACAVVWLTKTRYFREMYYFNIDRQSIEAYQYFEKKWLLIYLLALIIISGSLIFLQFDLKIGARVDPVSGFGAASLPFKLAGIINISTKLIVPALFLNLIFIANYVKNTFCFHLGLMAYIVYCSVFTIITTSRAFIPGAIVLLSIIWSFSGCLTTGRRNFLIALTPLFPLIFGIATRLRFLREVGQVGQIYLIPEAFNQVIYNSEVWDSYLYFPLTRINGLTTLFYIQAYQPQFNLGTIYHKLTEFGFNINLVYKHEILGITDYGFSASPGLTGCLYLLSGSVWLVAIGVFLHTIFWFLLYYQVFKMNLYTKPVALAEILLLSAFFTSSGSYHLIPVCLLGIAVTTLLGEVFIRFLLNIPILPSR
jgi:hypothetical protein